MQTNKAEKKRVMVDVSRRRHKLTEDQIDEAVLMYNSGASQKAVAKHFGVSAPTMRKYLKLRTPPEGGE